MALTQYCELDEVRAALGVNLIELPDTVLNLPVYEMGLVRELAKISESLPAAFLSAAALAPEDRSSDQERLFSAGRLFSVAAVARRVGNSLANLAPKDVSDGKAALSRFADSPYRDVLSRVETEFAESRVDLQSAYSAMEAGAQAPNTRPGNFFSAVPRASDPVTGA